MTDMPASAVTTSNAAPDRVNPIDWQPDVTSALAAAQAQYSAERRAGVTPTTDLAMQRAADALRNDPDLTEKSLADLVPDVHAALFGSSRSPRD